MQTPFWVLNRVNNMPEILLDAIIDSLKLFPFLFLTYLFLEYLEHKTSDKFMRIIRKAGHTGPLCGSILGAVPQCGFSVVAANFYAARVIGLGTLIAVFLSTSDEVLPIFISSGMPIKKIICIIGYKIICGVIFGYLLHCIYYHKKRVQPVDIETICKNEHCQCNNSILRPALWHSLRITLFIFLVVLTIDFIFSYVNQHSLIQYLQKPVWGELLSGLFGLLPNCSTSVILAQLYLDNCINIGSFMSGSLVNAGVGLLVLFRINKNLQENICILFILYICGICGGLVCNLINWL